MAQWIETKLRYDKMCENGVVKKVNEPYLVDALTFTEAESRIIEERQPYISGEFTVSAVKKCKISEVVDTGEGDRWYSVKAMFISFDEKTGAEKKALHEFIVKANTLEEAIDNFKSQVTLLVDYELAGVNETALMDVYPAKL